MPSRRNRKNSKILPATREVGEHAETIATSKRNMYFSQTPEQLKAVFQEAIRQVGFVGFSSYSSICRLLPDTGILSTATDPFDENTFENSSPLGRFMDTFSTHNLYNDIAERFGDYSTDYLYNIEEMSDRYFRESALDSTFQNPPRVTPFLTIQDAPRSDQPLMHAVLNLGTKFSQPPIDDQLNIPIEAANGRIIYLGLFVRNKLDLSTLYAGTVLSNNYHQQCRRLMHVEKYKKNDNRIQLGETQLDCLKWAVAGKTVEDIAEITGYRSCTVRYHMEQARKRYGYTTMRQTLVRAAMDYWLDPLG
ncbi:MAG: LuxR C-terminal-related transcriptional regulator [Sneathiella sp.]